MARCPSASRRAVLFLILLLGFALRILYNNYESVSGDEASRCTTPPSGFY